MTTDAATLDNICAGGQTLARTDKFATVNTTAGMELCNRVQLYCVGQADGEEEAPPWDEEGPAEETDASGGCATGNGGSAWLVFLLGAVVIGFTRRRK